MNLYEILMFLEGHTIESAEKHLKSMGVDECICKHILNCYDKNRKLIKNTAWRYNAIAISR